jgi:hypothetical protein
LAVCANRTTAIGELPLLLMPMCLLMWVSLLRSLMVGAGGRAGGRVEGKLGDADHGPHVES